MQIRSICIILLKRFDLQKNPHFKFYSMKPLSQKKIIVLLIAVFVIAIIIGIIIGRNTVGFDNNLSKIQSLEENINFKGFEEADPQLYSQILKIISKRYIQQPINAKDLFYSTIGGLVDGLGDPYSVFLKPELAKEFAEDMAGSFEGIGIEIGIKDNRLTVIAPLSDTPASRVGLRAGDKILTIDKKDTSHLSADEASHLIRGTKGTEVVLGIVHIGGEKFEEIKIIRDVISIKTVSWELKGDDMAYLEISHFSDETWNDFQDIAEVILRANPKGLILDLRNNPGGYLDTAVDMAGYWLGQKIIVTSRNAVGEETKYQVAAAEEFKKIPTIVLVNRGSASASEILAGALQDYKQATILGEKTFGKGSVQELETFSDGSALKLTVAHWYTPLGRSINEAGITPDVEVKFTEEDYLANRDPQLDKALDLLRGATLLIP